MKIETDQNHKSLSSEHQEKKFHSIEQVFEELLGIPFPEIPQDMPNEILITKIIYSGLIDAILAQETEDKLSKDGLAKERSQFVGILDILTGEIKNTKIFLGLPMRTKDGLAELKRWFHPLFGQGIKPLAYWHTHTEKADSPFPTESDIAQRLGEDRKCIIYLHGSPTEISAIIQTKKAYPKRIPLSTIKKGFDLYDRIIKIYNSVQTPPELEKLAQFLEEQGYVFYRWEKHAEVHTVKDGVESGSFLSGVRMSKIQAKSS